MTKVITHSTIPAIDFKDVESYQKRRFDCENETIPEHSPFVANECETFVLESAPLFKYSLVKNELMNGTINSLDKTILGLIATFAGAAFLTNKILSQLLYMLGVDCTDKALESSIKKLYRLNLISYGRFYTDDRLTYLRLIALSQNGSNLAKEFGIQHAFNAKLTRKTTGFEAKSRAQISQLLLNFMKRSIVKEFEIRPVIVVHTDLGKIVRPACSININGNKVFFEVPRCHPGYLDNIIDKLHRYNLCFKDPITLVINGESESMNRDIFFTLKRYNYKFEIFYTDDLAMFGNNFRYCLYSFNDNGDVQYYEFINLDNI